ncbi:aromatic ring-hydroxylating dioxygenase subunit alpha [Pseudonocardia nematodicida]|uniref:Aromatic ring-hydroxylating dioxygenase subunit alpha n=1 Tax=Pseudonocardia nematodicida TaxID=1206997 RepID=A0ABV1KIY6_9PSEU
MSDLAVSPTIPAARTPMVARTPGWSLPQSAYTDPDVFRADLDLVFGTGWLFATHSCEVREPGEFVTVTVGDESVIVVRGADGVLRGHHNVCAHRGSRVALEPRGCVKALVCPYHQWVYDLDGSARSARLMGPDFQASRYRLAPVAVREVAGLVFLCLADQPPDFDAFAAALAPQLGPHGLDRARVAVRDTYTVRANWKTIVENNRECYHCQGNHPEFLLSNYQLGAHGDVRTNPRYDRALGEAYDRWTRQGLAPAEVSFPDGEWYRISRLPLRDGFLTETLDGRPVGPLLGDLTDPDAGSLRIIGLPNMWAHANSDYAVTTRLTPVDAATTEIEVAFLVPSEATDVDEEALTAVWRSTSEQDWELCENNYAGIRSRAYRPGPLSDVVESSVEAFVDWYLTRLGAGSGDQRGWASP